METEKNQRLFQPRLIAARTGEFQEGKFLLSYNDHPELRKACRGFKIEKLKTDYTINKGRHDVGLELLIRNY